MASRRPTLNFVTSPSGLLVPEITDDPTNDRADITFDIAGATTDGWVLTSEGGSAEWQPPSGGNGNGDWDVVVTKSTDESVSSNTSAQADDELHFTPTSGVNYEWEIACVYASPAGGGTPDLKFQFYEDGTTRGSFIYWGLSTADALAFTGLVCSSAAAAATAGTATTNRTVLLRGWYVGNGVQAGFQWAQNTSSGNATIVRAGSTFRYRVVV